MPVHVIDEANRCLQCKNPMCRNKGCPIHTNIPEVIRLFKENRMMEAAQILFDNNPLSVVCSLVCNHENQCEGHCVRGIKGEPDSGPLLQADALNGNHVPPELLHRRLHQHTGSVR